MSLLRLYRQINVHSSHNVMVNVTVDTECLFICAVHDGLVNASFLALGFK